MVGRWKAGVLVFVMLGAVLAGCNGGEVREEDPARINPTMPMTVTWPAEPEQPR